MADPLQSSIAVVTLRSLPEPSRVEAASAGSHTRADVDPVERALLVARYRALRSRLEAESATHGEDVLVAPNDPELSRFMSRLVELGLEGETLGPGGQELKFGTGFEGRDWFGWLKSTFDWVDRAQAHPFIWSTAPAEPIGDPFRIGIMGDWGTNLYGAPKIADRLRRDGSFDLVLHLGDIYYSGTADETKLRFLTPWPFDAGRRSRALNANHEMYSGGYGYFDLVMPRFDQPASYFAMQNDAWLLVGLDTAYVDHDLDPKQVTWLEGVIAAAGTRKVVLFSHQQLFSRLSDEGDKLKARLATLLGAKRIAAWYWGHEHQSVIYDRHPRWGLAARCLGNSGIPEPRVKEVRDAPADTTVSYVTWRRLDVDPARKPDTPRALVMDGPNPDVGRRKNDFGPHAYMTLDFQGPVLTERVLLPDGTVVYEGRIE